MLPAYPSDRRLSVLVTWCSWIFFVFFVFFVVFFFCGSRVPPDPVSLGKWVFQKDEHEGYGFTQKLLWLHMFDLVPGGGLLLPSTLQRPWFPWRYAGKRSEAALRQILLTSKLRNVNLKPHLQRTFEKSKASVEALPVYGRATGNLMGH